MPTENIFERVSDMAAGVITRQKEAVRKGLGLDGRPYRAVALKPAERAEYFASLDPQRQAKVWEEMSEGERAEAKQFLGG